MVTEMDGQPFRATKEHVHPLAAQNSFFALRQKRLYFPLDFQPCPFTHLTPESGTTDDIKAFYLII